MELLGLKFHPPLMLPLLFVHSISLFNQIDRKPEWNESMLGVLLEYLIPSEGNRAAGGIVVQPGPLAFRIVCGRSGSGKDIANSKRPGRWMKDSLMWTLLADKMRPH